MYLSNQFLSRRPKPGFAAKQNHSSTVAVRLQDILPVMAKAFEENVAWIGDFEDDTISVSKDLYDVIAAAKQFQHSTGKAA